VLFYFAKEGDGMRIADLIPKEQKQQLGQIKSPKKDKHQKPKPKTKPKPKKEEKVNWYDIMGHNRQVLRRKKGGAWG
jgi:predicted RNA-binding protein